MQNLNITDMRKLFVGLTVLFALIMSSYQANAQLQVQVPGGAGFPSNWNVDSLVQNILVGQGVQVFNVRFNGSTSLNCSSIGKFTTGTTPTNLGLTSGIMIGTGNVTMAAGANNSGSSSQSGCSGYNPSDNPLAPLASSSVNDCAILEFDFVPRSDSIKFRYVFASEEYPEYVCSDYNDIFGFFITGINPDGLPYNNTNIALVPGTTNTVISINNVNGGGHPASSQCNPYNTQYYVDNTGGATIQYDGFTTVLTAEAKVYPCTQYHLKMCIADLGDGAYDSGVFLEANSLTSNGITPTFRNRANPDNPSQLYEGCCADIVLRRPTARNTSTQISVQIGGTATNGGDYDFINPVQFLPAGADSMVLHLCPYKDGIDEGEETIEIILDPADGCPDTITFSILDSDPMNMGAVKSPLAADSLTARLHVNVQGGMSNRTTTWRNLGSGQTRWGDTIIVNTVPRTNRWMAPEQIPMARWVADVEDFCFNVCLDTVFVGVLRDFATEPRDTIICEGFPLTFTMQGADSCVWRQNDLGSAPINTHNTEITVYPTANCSYIVSSYAKWAGQWWEDIDTIVVFVVPTPELHVSASTTEICPGDPVTLTGSGLSTYSFDGGQTYGTGTTHTYYPDSTQFITVFGKTTAAECPGKDSIQIVVDFYPTITIEGPQGACGGESVILESETNGTEFFWTASPSDPTLGNQTQNHDILITPAVTTTYTLTATYGVCTDSKTHEVHVEPSPIAIGEVTPKTVNLGQMEATFVDHSEHTTTRDWYFPDGTVKHETEVTYVVPDEVDSAVITLVAYNPYLCTDTTEVIVYVDHTTLWAPNAFTPDESTNKVFEVKMNAVRDYLLLIYNRAGQLVYRSTDPEAFWDGKGPDGKPCPEGSYVYFISIHKTAYPYEQLKYSGTVTLIR